MSIVEFVQIFFEKIRYGVPFSFFLPHNKEKMFTQAENTLSPVNDPISFSIPKKNIIFAFTLVRLPHSQKAIKRESGENPEQSRCCKLFTTFRIILFATVSGNQFTVLTPITHY
jgi:hypothetical protein